MDLGNVSENLDRFPNMNVDIAARIGELGRQQRTARRFFDKYQDRWKIYGIERPEPLPKKVCYENAVGRLHLSA